MHLSRTGYLLRETSQNHTSLKLASADHATLNKYSVIHVNVTDTKCLLHFMSVTLTGGCRLSVQYNIVGN